MPGEDWNAVSININHLPPAIFIWHIEHVYFMVYPACHFIAVVSNTWPTEGFNLASEILVL